MSLLSPHLIAANMAKIDDITSTLIRVGGSADRDCLCNAVEMSLREFEEIVAALLDVGIISERNRILTWIGCPNDVYGDDWDEIANEQKYNFR